MVNRLVKVVYLVDPLVSTLVMAGDMANMSVMVVDMAWEPIGDHAFVISVSGPGSVTTFLPF